MKPNGYFVTKRETCPTCGGEGLIQHSAWREYWQTHRAAGTLSAAESDRWFTAHGYQLDALLPEEIECPNCDGQGYVESEVPLQDVLPDMLVGLIDAMGLVRRS